MKTLNLKTIIITILSLIMIVVAFGVSAFMSPENDIIGTWVSNEDELWKITFTSSGQRNDYYENVLVETSSYQITNTCSDMTRNNNELFLKTTGEGETVCDLLNGIHTDENGIKTLSITSERGKLYLFTKQ